MVQKLLLFAFISAVFLIPGNVVAQHAQVAGNEATLSQNEGSLVNWMTLPEAMEKVKTQPRPILMDFYTDWCGWCKQMMKTTYANKDLAQYVNTNFYPVKFNAERRDTVEYLGQKYGPTDTSRKATSTLAIKLLQGKLMYPTTLFLNNYDKQKNEFGFSMLAQGYLDNVKLEPILVFTLENAFHNSSYDDFKAGYDVSFYDTATERKLKDLKWLSPVEAFNNKTSSKKKTLVLIHTEWCNACRVMQRSSFIDTTVQKYLKDKYDLVDFNPEMMDVINFKGQSYSNARTPQAPFHQLATALCRNSFILPTLVVLDENFNIIDAIPFYLNSEVVKNLSAYYGDDIYKKKSWKDYMAEVTKKEKKQ